MFVSRAVFDCVVTHCEAGLSQRGAAAACKISSHTVRRIVAVVLAAQGDREKAWSAFRRVVPVFESSND